MKTTNLIKIILVLVLSTMLILGISSTFVYAADDDGFGDLTSTLNNTNTNNSNNTNTNNTNTNTNNTNVSNTNSNNSATSSVYNNTNTNLPKTGISDSIPVAMLVVIFGISAIYAYKKISEYKNV